MIRDYLDKWNTNVNEGFSQCLKLHNIVLIWTTVSILLAGSLDITYVNCILLGVWLLIVILYFFIDKHVEKKYTKRLAKLVSELSLYPSQISVKDTG